MLVRYWQLTTVCLVLACQPAATVADARTDCFGDPLPDGAVARMGTVRFRHGGEVRFVAALPDGKTIVSTDAHSIRWWDAASGKEVRRWSDGEAFLGNAALSPDGKVLAAAVEDDLRAWDAAGGKELWKAEKVGRIVTAFSPDSKVLATVGESIRFRNAATGAVVREFEAKVGASAVAFAPDGRTMLSLGVEGIRWWDLASGKIVHEAEAHKGVGCFVAVASDGKRFATAGLEELRPYDTEATVRLWDAAGRTELRRLLTYTRREHVAAVAFSPDGKQLASGDSDGRIYLYDAGDGAELRRWEGHEGAVTALAFAADGKTLITGGADAAIRQWDSSTGKELSPVAGLEGPVCALAVSPDGATLASAGKDHRIHLWDAATGQKRRDLVGSFGERTGLLAFWPDGQTLTSAYAGIGDDVCLWQVADGKRIHSFSPADRHYFPPTLVSPDGRILVCYGGGKLALMEAGTGAAVLTIESHGQDEELCGCAFIRDRSTFAAFVGPVRASRNADALVVWNAATGERETRPLHGDVGRVLACAASPDGKVLAAHGGGGEVHFVAVETGEAAGRLDSGLQRILTAVFSPDGRTLALTGFEGGVHLWEAASGRKRGVLRGQDAPIDAVAFSPDGKRLYSGGRDGTVLAWDLTGRSAAGRSRRQGA